jgi:hypothetical protein
LVFKRKYPRPLWRRIAEFLWPRGGWGRAASYVRLRLQRLPDTPEKIARGIFVGVFTAFTPFYGLHFLTAALLAKMLRGNILASLLGTFFGNPLTYVPIGIVSLQTGHLILGTDMDVRMENRLVDSFFGAWADLWRNFVALFTEDRANWANLSIFYETVFIPYLVGGLIPGVVAGLVCYYLSKPVISAYQKRRKGKLAAKLAELRKKALRTADHGSNAR